MRTRLSAAKEAASATSKQDDAPHGNSSVPPKAPSLLGFSLPMCMFFCTGIAMSLIGQLNTNKGVADARAQLISWVKYLSAVLSHGLALHYAPPATLVSWGARRLMWALAALDVVAYGLFVKGFNAVGAALSTVLFAGLGQCFTAFMSVFVLRRPLAPLQVASLAVILGGLLLRAAPQLLADPSAGAVAGGWVGISSLIGSTFFYAVMGVVYEHLLAQTPAPEHSVTMFTISAVGLACTSAYVAVCTLPRWTEVVETPMHVAGTPWWQALLCWLAFGVVYNGHTYAQRQVLASEGALGVCVANALRGPAVSVGVALLFCSADAPKHCLTVWGALSAVAVAVGVYLWGVGKAAAAKVDKADKAKIKSS